MHLKGGLRSTNGRLVGDGLAVLVMVAGAVLRGRHFFFDRDLWLDEAMLALNIVNRGFGGLLQPLELNQAAPLGFLYLSKIATLLFGQTELAFRLVPFLASLATLPLFYLLVRSILGVRGALFALTLLAISPTAVEYAGEAKQYAFDLLAAIVVLMAANFYWRGEKPRAARLALAAAGSLTLLFSHGVIFVTASAGLVLLAREIFFRRWVELGRLAVAGSAVTVAGLANHIFHLRSVAGNDHFATYWANSLTGASPFTACGMEDIAEAWVELFELFLALHLPQLGILVFFGGLVALALRGRGFWTAVTGLPLLFVTVAALMDGYPFSDRLLLFLVPLLALGVASGIEGLIVIRKGWIFIAGWILAWLMLGETVRHLHEDGDFLHPRKPRKIQPALIHIRENLLPGDAIYVDGLVMPVYRFYTEIRPGYAELLTHPTVFGPHQGKFEGTPEQKLEELGDPSRFWAVFQHIKGDDQQEIIETLRREGTQTGLFAENESRIYLFDL